MPKEYPSRIVCLSAEAVEILYRLDCGERIVGITGFAVEPPEARRKPRVSGFSTVNYDKIDALEPDLVITFSDVQAAAARELIGRGHVVLATNQRSLLDIFDTISLMGGVTGQRKQAQRLVEAMRREIWRDHDGLSTRQQPKVYFEEWDEPLISGIRWISELIEAAGGCDIFPELRGRSRASDRVVAAEEVIHRRPEIIVASWCGKKVNLSAICQRSGWEAIPAVRNGRVHEIKSAQILQPGPSLLKGLAQLRQIIQAAR